MSEQTNISFEAALMIALRADVYVEKAFVVHCCFSGDSLELCLHRNGR